MSMEIGNSYASYYTNTFSDSKIDEKQRERSEDNKQKYYEKLCKKFPQIKFNTNGGVLPCSSNKVIVNLSDNCLKKMASDPEFAKEVEWNLSGEVTANSLVNSWARRDGVELGGRTVTYDANGNRQSSCGGMRTANVGNEKNHSQKLQRKYQSEEERYLKIRKKRQEQEEFEEHMAEKRRERETYLDQLSEDKCVLKNYQNTDVVNQPYIDTNI